MKYYRLVSTNPDSFSFYKEGYNKSDNGIMIYSVKSIFKYWKFQTELYEVNPIDTVKVDKDNNWFCYEANFKYIGKIKNEFFRLFFSGADIHYGGDRALCSASGLGYLEIVKFLIKNDAYVRAWGDEPLINAVFYGHKKIVGYLLKNGANIHARQEYPLRIAINNKNIDMIKYLIKKGADARYCKKELLNLGIDL